MVCLNILTVRGNLSKYSVYMMKAKAEAEAKQMQAQGLKRGEDFLDCKSHLTARFLCCLFSRACVGFLLFLLLVLVLRKARREVASKHTGASGST